MESNLFVRSFANIEEFTLEWEDAISVSADDPETGDGQRLGRISLRQNQSAVTRVLRPGVVRVVQLGNACRNNIAFGGDAKKRSAIATQPLERPLILLSLRRPKNRQIFFTLLRGKLMI